MIPPYVLFDFLEQLGLDKLPVTEVKRLWDEYDGLNSPGGYSGEAIHANLCKRGEKDYCAV